MIELKNITKTFEHKGKKNIALSNISLSVSEGKIVGVIGESGAGKSTLIRCVNLLERPNSGEVWIDGQNLMELSPSKLTSARRNIGMIFQHFNLLSSRTVFDNIAFPLELNHTPKTKIKNRVYELVEMVGLTDKLDSYPANLSGGQKQRVAIARTLANNPKVLLSDEATSALDPSTTRSILSLLKDLNKELGITILLITHEMDVVKQICDDIAVMNGGKLIEQGSVSEIFSNPKTELAQRFISSSLHLEIPVDYQKRITHMPEEGKHPLLKLQISGNTVDEPVLSEISRLFDINNNIISAQMDYAGGVKFGVMLTEIIGTISKEMAAIEYLKSKNIKVTLLGYV
ncbi:MULTISPECIES: methionine ABC transporter ATP-binding protein MetN [Apibacter]|uniref:methionine ABC transporter ATP-binding protein MetN n=1 Tax=Apibacter TaxID=1778601 RepID=UPI001323171A|nr:MULTISPECIES: methionine ABC transporter ATP-binding protein MetN [Apibacter]MCX8676704.1 methionine ABC transporter ATP-binding protein MetN [Apibacter sp. B3919]MXO24912.1 methionine ABC transporter ATP-binding protein MetN [Apibacter sp. B3924]MXO26157.1 methionine ABC transporter ATP-binding protein MetN [Apibacter sp. B3813]MXO28108.1 methionine ABC transporter ATP-binding protein MetN [Apibacter sp. B3913]MXO29532.1 methionine ABC transporter ATP-binding protein MetN [Apibacter sp. B3